MTDINKISQAEGSMVDPYFSWKNILYLINIFIFLKFSRKLNPELLKIRIVKTDIFMKEKSQENLAIEYLEIYLLLI